MGAMEIIIRDYKSFCMVATCAVVGLNSFKEEKRTAIELANYVLHYESKSTISLFLFHYMLHK